LHDDNLKKKGKKNPIVESLEEDDQPITKETIESLKDVDNVIENNKENIQVDHKNQDNKVQNMDNTNKNIEKTDVKNKEEKRKGRSPKKDKLNTITENKRGRKRKSVSNDPNKNNKTLNQQPEIEKRRRGRPRKFLLANEIKKEEDDFMNRIDINGEDKEKIKKYFFSEIDNKIDKIIEDRLDETLNESIASLIKKNNTMSENNPLSNDIKKLTLYDIIRLFVHDVDGSDSDPNKSYNAPLPDKKIKEDDSWVDHQTSSYDDEGIIKKKSNNNDEIMIIEVPSRVIKQEKDMITVIDDDTPEDSDNNYVEDEETESSEIESTVKSTLMKNYSLKDITPYKNVNNNVMNDLSLLCDLSTHINTILNETKTKTKEMKYCLENISNYVKEQKSILCQVIILFLIFYFLFFFFS